MNKDIFEQIAGGRTDLVFDYTSADNAATASDNDVSLLQWCSYYGDVSAMKFLLSLGASLESLGEYYGLNTAAYHGHVALCEFLIAQGEDVNQTVRGTGETPLHSAIATDNREQRDKIIEVLPEHGANPNCATNPAVATDHFMRDCRTKAETPLHRAAAFGSEQTIDMLLAAGARVDALDIHGDSPLSWGSWYLRPRNILQKLCYGNYYIS